jgi:uncharacterized membrane protein YkoI
MRRLLITASVLCLAVPAYAQDEGAITVIQDDGTKVTVPIGGVDPVLPGEMDAPPQQAAPVPPAEKPLIVPEVAPRSYVDPIVEQPSREAEKAPAPESKKSKAEKSKHPKPPRVPTQRAVKQSLPPGTEISERQATSIAMDAAPASSGFTSSRQTYQGKPVYVVTFKTDEGPYDVLVDAASGAVVVSAYVETHERKPTAPGHLPSDWEPYNPQPVGRPKAAP